ncbi:hypothetical protein [Thiolapillus sp.]
MNAKRTSSQKLETLIDDAVESVMAMTEEELRQSFHEAGTDLETEAAWVAELISSKVTVPKESLVELSRKALDEGGASKFTFRLPDTVEERRALFDQLRARPGLLDPALMMAFRDANDLSDQDIEGILENLGELGLLDETDERE